MLKTIMLFILSIFLATVLMSVVSTQIILADVQSFGLSISTKVRLRTTMQDLFGLAPALFLLISMVFLIGFVLAKYAHQLLGGNRTLWYIVLGISSFPVTIYLMQYLLGLIPIASARTPLGLLLMTCCCLPSAWLFALLASPTTAKSSQLENNNAQ